MRSCWKLPFCILNTPSPLSLSPWQKSSSPLSIPVPSLLQQPHISLCWGAQALTQCSRWGLRRAELKGTIPPCPLPPSMQPGAVSILGCKHTDSQNSGRLQPSCTEEQSQRKTGGWQTWAGSRHRKVSSCRTAGPCNGLAQKPLLTLTLLLLAPGTWCREGET